MTLDWTEQLVEQLDWHWRTQARPRLDGLGDDEYLWEPVAGCWNIRPRGQGIAEIAGGFGEHVIDFSFAPGEPAPVTTIAWRLAHVIVGVFGMRAVNHFGWRPDFLPDGASVDYMSFDYAGTAAGALAQLDASYAAWREGVRGLDAAGLAATAGPAEEPWGEQPMAGLVLHINREAIHHLGEIALLRDLYAHRAAR